MTQTVPEPEHETEHDLLILFATETGTAQDAAETVARTCRRLHFRCKVMDMEAYNPPDLISESRVIFVVSTTGSGAEPRPMTPLWAMLLRSDLPQDLFEDLSFAVFGLGDSAYEKFCWPAKKLSRRLESLGAHQVFERGEGDEQDPLGIDGMLDLWCDGLLEKLLSLYPLPEGVELVSKAEAPPPRIKIRAIAEPSSSDLNPPPEGFETPERVGPSLISYYAVKVAKNTRITASDWYQDVRHLEFDFAEDIRYSPGDVAVIHPIASALDVEEFLTLMGWGNTADDCFDIEPNVTETPLPLNVPRQSTLRVLFTRFVNFNAVPRREFFRFLRHFTTDELERERIDEFLSREGADELYEYTHKVRRTIWEVLTEFRNVRIPKEYIFDVFPPLRPREFSIASSVKRHPRQVQLCVAIVKYKTALKVPRRGVCTTFLAGLTAGDTITVGLKPGLLKLPQDPGTPVICVGPGTGIAPMRAVIEDRMHSGIFATTLYFGCRSAAKDHHYGSEWRKYAEQEHITYRVAFSRDGPEGMKRTYVQDLMREDAARLWELIGKQDAWVLISGSSNKMPAAVKEAVAYATENVGGQTADEAKQYVARMEREGRLIEECWS
ncbi:hypothetical protein HGRIS_007040 [Hohenbuehelia grisea]|uniref:NADPH-dependent diflavin oxidoreductase 1 n=1 Tax=Hohenbuehelia grisea TaxID=104357 RepID=A0ABR3JBE3_9AGAR